MNPMAIDCLDPSGLPDVRLRRAVFSMGQWWAGFRGTGKRSLMPRFEPGVQASGLSE